MQHRVESELKRGRRRAVRAQRRAGRRGPGDRFIAEALAGSPVPVVVAVNKVDRLDRPRTVLALRRRPTSGSTTPRCSRSRPAPAAASRALVDHLAGLLPEGPFYFPPDEVSDQPEHVMLAELVREQVLHRTRQEVPHAVEVQVDEIHRAATDLVIVRAFLWVETESQKGILIGAHGRMIKAIGMAARRELERELGSARAPRPVGPGARAPGAATRRCSTASGSPERKRFPPLGDIGGALRGPLSGHDLHGQAGVPGPRGGGRRRRGIELPHEPSGACRHAHHLPVELRRAGARGRPARPQHPRPPAGLQLRHVRGDRVTDVGRRADPARARRDGERSRAARCGTAAS